MFIQSFKYPFSIFDTVYPIQFLSPLHTFTPLRPRYGSNYYYFVFVIFTCGFLL